MLRGLRKLQQHLVAGKNIPNTLFWKSGHVFLLNFAYPSIIVLSTDVLNIIIFCDHFPQHTVYCWEKKKKKGYFNKQLLSKGTKICWESIKCKSLKYSLAPLAKYFWCSHPSRHKVELWFLLALYLAEHWWLVLVTSSVWKGYVPFPDNNIERLLQEPPGSFSHLGD